MGLLPAGGRNKEKDRLRGLFFSCGFSEAPTGFVFRPPSPSFLPLTREVANPKGLAFRLSSFVQKEEGLREEHGSARQIARGPRRGAARRFRRNARD